MTIRRSISAICRRSSYYDPHERIEYIAGEVNGLPWKETETRAVYQIKAKTHAYYVLVNGCEVDVVIARCGDDEYLKTETDAYSPDNLLNLGEAAI